MDRMKPIETELRIFAVDKAVELARESGVTDGDAVIHDATSIYNFLIGDDGKKADTDRPMQVDRY